MCPLCAATVIMTVAGSSSAGGVTALAVRKLRWGDRAKMSGALPRLPHLAPEATVSVSTEERK